MAEIADSSLPPTRVDLRAAQSPPAIVRRLDPAELNPFPIDMLLGPSEPNRGQDAIEIPKLENVPKYCKDDVVMWVDESIGRVLNDGVWDADQNDWGYIVNMGDFNWLLYERHLSKVVTRNVEPFK